MWRPRTAAATLSANRAKLCCGPRTAQAIPRLTLVVLVPELGLPGQLHQVAEGLSQLTRSDTWTSAALSPWPEDKATVRRKTLSL